MGKEKRFIARVIVDEVTPSSTPQASSYSRNSSEKEPDSVQQSTITVRANSYEKLAKKVNAAMQAIALDDE